MYVLGIESSCDETSVAIVKDGKTVLSNVVSSSLSFHKKYGGVIPEIASRMSLETITQVADSCFKEAGLSFKDISLISVTNRPGLLGSLLVGLSFAKGLSLSLNLPILGVDHILAHIYANFLAQKAHTKPSFRFGCKQKTQAKEKIKLPIVALIISGGHSSLFYIKDFNKVELLGQTQDDASGEAFDKVAKILGLGYPGGPAIEKLAEKGDFKKTKFNCSDTKKPLNFSFSGIKTAVLYKVKASHNLSIQDKADIAASFQETVIDTLVKKTLLACKMKKVNTLLVGGGVASNGRLRSKFNCEFKNNNIKVYFPAKDLCIDNAAMVAGLGYQLFKRGIKSELDLNVEFD